LTGPGAPRIIPPMPKIEAVHAREILDSRGNPTLEVEVVTDEGILGRAAVPSGASTGEREALELRDGDAARFAGKGVLKAAANVVERIAPRIVGAEVTDQRQIDRLVIDLDGTPTKSALGANAILGVSLAAAKASAASQGRPLHEIFGPGRLLPCPFMNVINGGAHADNNLDFQEFMIVPGGLPRFADALRAGCEIFHSLKAILKSQNLSTSVGDEGGFAPNLRSVEETLETILAAVEKAGYKPGAQVALALDVAASGFFREGRYQLARAGVEETAESLNARYSKLCDAYPLVSIEDGLAEGDWDGWAAHTEALGARTQLVGDDLFVTNPAILKQGIDRKIATAVLIKLNQIGTVSETLEAIRIAQQAGYGVMISHRSGETEDVSIVHLAVGTGAGMIKTGSVTRTDRTAKYNELLRIEESLGSRAEFGGFAGLRKRAA
jgi:enolase